MKDYCFLITDSQHKTTYASKKSEDIFKQKSSDLLGKMWIELVSSPTPEFIQDVIYDDIKNFGFFNGIISFNSHFWFCDYGKRYDAQGKQIGFELIIRPTNSNAVNYITHFYQSINDKARANNHQRPADLFREEITQLSETLDTDYLEVLNALQNGEE